MVEEIAVARSATTLARSANDEDPRTLQRRLAEDGATFQQLVQAARHELARHYLTHSSLELNETAYLLGYEDAHSFFRAFHQWEGSSPGEWRKRHARSPRSRVVAPAAGGGVSSI